MPRQLIIDAHERINEIPTVPTYRPVKRQPRERAWIPSAGKEDPIEFDSSLARRSARKVQNRWEILVYGPGSSVRYHYFCR